MVRLAYAHPSFPIAKTRGSLARVDAALGEDGQCWRVVQAVPLLKETLLPRVSSDTSLGLLSWTVDLISRLLAFAADFTLIRHASLCTHPLMHSNPFPMNEYQQISENPITEDANLYLSRPALQRTQSPW